MRIGGHCEITFPNGKTRRFTVVGELPRRGGIWVVEDDVMALDGKRWMFGKDCWIERNSIEVPFV